MSYPTALPWTSSPVAGAIGASANSPAAHYAVAVKSLETKDFQKAVVHAEYAHVLEPKNADVVSCLAAACHGAGDLEGSVRWYRQLISLKADYERAERQLAGALALLGKQKMKDGHPEETITLVKESLQFYALDAGPFFSLGQAYDELKNLGEALINYRLAVHFDPHLTEGWYKLGRIFQKQMRFEKALKHYHIVLQQKPHHPASLNAIGEIYLSTGNLTDAFSFFNRAIYASSDFLDAWKNLGHLYWDCGEVKQVIRMYERCLDLEPSAPKPAHSRLLALNYLQDVGLNDVFEAHRVWGQCIHREVEQFVHASWTLNPMFASRRPLRIGYVSPDFFQHPVSFFFISLLEYRNANHFEVFLYSNTLREDEKTELFKKMVPSSNWRTIVDQPAIEIAHQIRDDRIDILIDLAGHTANNRLDVFALKPAPVQFTYIGYNNTTGLGAIDYRITDAVVDPQDTKQQFVEELVRLPRCFLCYTPPPQIPDVNSLPALRNGYTTFGSFSCMAKISDPCIALWARLLRELPTSRLILKNKGFFSADVRARLLERFKCYGIVPKRLTLLPLTQTSFEHLDVYNQLDIALDTFPYANTTTTCESLLMGVPTICLYGESHSARVGATLLGAIGLETFVAKTQDNFLHIAKCWSGDHHGLCQLRKTLREKLLDSPLCDGPTFVRDNFEPMLVQKWDLYCQGRPPSKQEVADKPARISMTSQRFAPAVRADVLPDITPSSKLSIRQANTKRCSFGSYASTELSKCPGSPKAKREVIYLNF